tara:strand:- start:29253 stop:30362 length:1110 start_codon:yes stop_codon:yes gene_type:complete
MKTYQRRLKTLASGHIYNLTYCQYTVPKPESKVYMQAALHGAEIQGLAVIRQLQKRLKEIVVPFDFKLLPLANPSAFDTKMGEYGYGRFDPRTGVNWNRGFTNLLVASEFFDAFDCDAFISEHANLGFEHAFRAFEKAMQERIDTLVEKSTHQAPEVQLALILHQEALEADYIFDLHCDSISKPYVYTPQYLIDKRLRNLTAQHFIATPCEFSPCFNQAIFYPFWVFTEKWNQKKGENQVSLKHAFTYELGSKERYCSFAAEEAVTGLLSYISDVGDTNTNSQAWWCAESFYKRLRAPCGGVFEKACELGKIHLAQEPIGQLHQLSEESLENSVITYDKDFIPLTITASPVVHQGDEVAKLMTQYHEVI